MDTIEEVVTNKLTPDDNDVGVEVDQPPRSPALVTDNDTTKSSQDSSFTVTDYNCSSLVAVSTAEIIELIGCVDGDGGLPDKDVIEADVVKVLNGGDGSDSGVEFGGISVSLNETGILQRALSNNSAGYASSCCGLEESNGVSVSCNSSMISYSSDAYDKTGSTILLGGTS